VVFAVEKYHHAPNVNLRALALKAAIWKRQGNPAWKGAANLAAGLGSIFANRLLIDELSISSLYTLLPGQTWFAAFTSRASTRTIFTRNA
jgi:hypothetical protein